MNAVVTSPTPAPVGETVICTPLKQLVEPVVSLIALDRDADIFKAQALRANWPDTGSWVYQVAYDLSLDGGATWASDALAMKPQPKPWKYGSFPRGDWSNGGDYPDKQGGIVPYTFRQIDLPDVGNPSRVVKITTTPLVPINTQIECACAVKADL